MRVTLVFCHVGVAGMNSDMPYGDREGSWIGHGCASVGASAKAAGYDVDLIDLRHLADWAQFEAMVKTNTADVYGISVSAVDHWHALRAVIAIKRAAPGCKVIVGGIHPSIFPGQYDFAAIDTVVQGEGEIAFVDLLKMIGAGQELPKIYRGAKPDLDAIPWVDRELFDYRREMACNFTPDQPLPSITMLAGRGCPYHCNYCQPAENAVFGSPYRLRSPENVVAELSYLKGRFKFQSITFWDDTFTFKTKWIEEFCDRYEAAKIGVPIVACSRADIICRNPGMVERLAEIGLTWFVIGLESGSQRVLDMIKKGTTVEQNIEASRICKSNGIKVFGTYMLGLPTETEDEALATIQMIEKIRPEHPSPFYFTPIPGTGIYDLCESMDLILPETKTRTIERTNRFRPTIKGVNYQYIDKLMNGHRERFAA